MRSSFKWLFVSTTSGSFADGIASVALPLLLISLTTDPILVALLQVASGLPWMMFSLHAGVLVDRMDRRTVLWVADASRAALAAALVVVVVLDVATVGALLGLAFLEGTATVLFRAASPAILPSLVERDELERANGRVQTGAVVTGGFLGPATGGVLYPVAAVAPFALQAISMTVSVLCLRQLPKRPAASEPQVRRRVRADIADGLSTVFSDRVLRSLLATTALLAASTGMLQAVLVLHVVDTLDAPEKAYGLLFAVFAAGCVLGGAITPRIRDRFGSRTCLIVGAALGAVGLAIIGSVPNVSLAGVGMAVLGIGAMTYNVSAVTVRQERTPEALLGRVSSVSNLAAVGALPLAALAAGGIAAAQGTTWALLAAATLCAAGLLWLVIDMGPIDRINEPVIDVEA